jgi:hypothetical protein
LCIFGTYEPHAHKTFSLKKKLYVVKTGTKKEKKKISKDKRIVFSHEVVAKRQVGRVPVSCKNAQIFSF